VLGGPLTQFTTVPDGAYHGVVDAHAPRAAGETDAEALELARENAAAAADRLDAAPTEPRAGFGNGATIALPSERGPTAWSNCPESRGRAGFRYRRRRHDHTPV